MNFAKTVRKDYNILLIKACKQQNIEKVKKLLKKGANPNYLTSKGESPLILAAYYGNIEMARLLIVHGAKTGLMNQFGDTALSIAMKFGNMRFADFVEKYTYYN